MLGRWIAACGRHHLPLVFAAFLLALGSVWLAATRLGVSTDTSTLFAASLPWRQHTAAIEKLFPQQQDLLVAVVDAATPEEADVTATDLAAALSGDHRHFTTVERPDASPYLLRNGLLFLDKDKLSALLDQTIDAQPFLGQLAADPSLRGLLSALGLIAEGVEVGQANLTGFEPALQGFHAALAQAVAGHPEPLSWERLLSGAVSDLAGKYRFVLAKPVLEYDQLQPGEAATNVLRAAAAGLEFVRAGRAHVRLTGSVALEDQEFATVAHGAVEELLGALALVTLLLFLAVRGWRLVVPVVITLVLGLLLTTGFAALAVGTLNLVSVAFAVLFTGIAVDFSIQFVARFREVQIYYPLVHTALLQTGRRAGVQILVASLASTAGFLAFTPTSFVGVAQLGLIAGFGMLTAFCCTVTFLPALLVLMAPRTGQVEVGLAWLRPLDPVLIRWHRVVVLGFAGLAVLAVAMLPWLKFDSDPLHTKDPNSEAVRTLQDLIQDPIANPYTIDVLAPSLQQVGPLVQQLKSLPTVDDVLSLSSFVPEDQAEKLPLLEDAANVLRTTLAIGEPAARPDAAAIRAAAVQVAEAFDRVQSKLPPGSVIVSLVADIGALSRASDDIVLTTDKAMTRFLPMQLDRLRTALEATPVTEADVPPDIRRNWVAPDGKARLQVLPKSSSMAGNGLRRFVAEVRSVAPEAGGSAITIIGSADTITGAFRTAGLLAVFGCALLLIIALRHVLDAALVLAPLLISGLLTMLLIIVLPLPLNFANIIALPLLLGVGVSFNVYFVMNWRARRRGPVGSATARAVLFSALTTATAFGTLAMSAHPGTASMGKLLLLSLASTLLTTMLFLPALLAWVKMPVEVRSVRRVLALRQTQQGRT